MNLRDPFGLAPDGWDCYIDHVASPCSLLDGLLLGGAAMACPRNICEYTKNIDGKLQLFRFVALASGGSGYYAYYGPGSLFFSAEAAGKAVDDYINPQAQREKVEYGSNIYVDANGVYSYTAPVTDGLYDQVTLDPRDIPEGTVYVGDYHVHVSDEETFAQDDIDGSDARSIIFGRELVFFLGTRGGRFLGYKTKGAPGSPCNAVVISGPPLPPGTGGCPTLY